MPRQRRARAGGARVSSGDQQIGAISHEIAMTNPPLATIILAAGKGTRMKSDLPKVLHPLAGRPLVAHVIAAARLLSPAQIVVVAPEAPEIAAAVAPSEMVVQEHQRGTADAVGAARGALQGFNGDVLVLYGDAPLIEGETLGALVAARRADPPSAVAVLGMRPEDPGAYGRLVLAADGSLAEIVEFRDATPEQRAMDLCSSGVMAVDAATLFELLAEVGDDNAKGEFYLTDIVGLARKRGWRCVATEAEADELVGINSRTELAQAEAVMQNRLRRAAMEEGATLRDPATTFLSFDTRLGRDVVVDPCVVFAPGVSVGDGAHIRAFSHIEDSTIESGAVIGPHARLRPGTRVGAGARVGNFVEIKNAALEAGAKANHLSYIGDARVGGGANVGAGTITCNYDGFGKARTDIGAGAFIGSNTALVAPVTVADGAIVGAGSVINRDVPENALALTRVPQEVKPGWAEKFRRRKRELKEKGE